MPNQWKLDLSEYGISDAATQELRYFCLRYPEMKRQLAEIRNPLHAMAYDGTPHDIGSGEPTAIAAEKAATLSAQVDMIERSAVETDASIARWLLDAVAKGLSFECERMKGIPCGEKYFNQRRREFFRRLAVKRKII